MKIFRPRNWPERVGVPVPGTFQERSDSVFGRPIVSLGPWSVLFENEPKCAQYCHLKNCPYGPFEHDGGTCNLLEHHYCIQRDRIALGNLREPSRTLEPSRTFQKFFFAEGSLFLMFQNIEKNIFKAKLKLKRVSAECEKSLASKAVNNYREEPSRPSRIFANIPCSRTLKKLFESKTETQVSLSRLGKVTGR